MYDYYNFQPEDPEEGMPSRWLIVAAIVFYLVAMALFLTGCTSTRYVPVERTVTELRYRDSIRHDSIYQRDSIYLEVGKDTIYKYKQRTEYRYLFLNKTDTVCRTDTVRITEIQRIEVEKPWKWYDRALLWYGRIAFCALIVILLFIYLQRKRN